MSAQTNMTAKEMIEYLDELDGEDQEFKFYKVKEPGRILRLMLKLANHGPALAASFILVYVVGSVLFLWFERAQMLSILDGFYWGDVTTFTVGFGDILPKTDKGKILTMIFIPIQCFLWVLFAAFMVVRLQLDQDKLSDREQKGLFRALKFVCNYISRIFKLLAQIAEDIRVIRAWIAMQPGGSEAAEQVRQQLRNSVVQPDSGQH